MPSSPRAVDIVAINYAPEVTGIGPYVEDVSRRLAAEGWDVRVVTGQPHYPQWSRMPVPATSTAGVIVERVEHSVPRAPGIVRRARMEVGFGIRVAARGLRPGSVLVLVSPPLIAAGIMLASVRLRGSRHRTGVWVQDLYTQAVVEAAGRSGLVAGAVRRLESGVLRSADSVAVAHTRFRDIAVSVHGVDPGAVVEIRNWNQAQPAITVQDDEARRALGLSVSSIIVVHAGNMGLKQGLENVVEAALLAELAQDDVHFYLVGDGNRRGALESVAGECSTVTFLDPLPDEEFHAMLQAADVLLVNEKIGVSEMSIPSKLTTYFSAGRPVVAAVDPAGITATEVKRAGAGVVVPAGDPRALLNAVVSVASDREVSARFGRSGQEYSTSELSPEAAVRRFGDWLDAIAVPASSQTAEDCGSTDRRLADYVVDKRDRGRNRVWLVCWLMVAALLRTGIGGSAGRVRALRIFGAEIADAVSIHKSFRVHFPWKVTIGARTTIGTGVWIIDPEPVDIGADCVIDAEVVLCSGGHDHRSPTFDRTSEAVSIGAGCHLERGVTVLKGVRMRPGTVVPAGDVVTRSRRREESA